MTLPRRGRRRAHIRCTMFASAALLVAANALADDVALSATQTTAVEWWSDNENGKEGDDNFVAIIERSNVGARTDNLELNARLDAYGFIFAPDERYQTQLRLERMSARTRFLDVELEVGDFYEQYGRGIGLSVRKLPEAGVDVSILGARARKVGATYQVSAFAGVANTANIDSISLQYVDDAHDVLSGAMFEMFPTSGVRIGQFVVFAEPRERILDDIDMALSAGTYLDLPSLTDFWSSYLEFLIQERMLAGRLQTGSAAYLVEEFHFGDFGVLLEGMLLNDYELKGSRNTALGSRFDYNRPPTLERIDQEVINSRDLVGARLRLEYYFFDWNTLVYGNAMLRLNEPGEENALVQSHTFLGFEYNFDEGRSRLNGAGGYRHEQLPSQNVPVKTMAHFDVDLVYAIPWALAVHLTSNTQIRTIDGRSHFWGSTFLGLERAGFGGATFELGYDTADQSQGVRNVFGALILAYEVSERITVQSIVGNQRGGIKCVAGVCREWPAFSGAKATLITRF